MLSVQLVASRYFGKVFFATVVLLNMVVVAFGVLSIQNSRGHHEKQADIQTQNLAQAVDQSISNSTDKINQSLRAVVYELEQQLARGKSNFTTLQGVIDLQKKLLPEATGFRIIDGNGDTLLGHADTRDPTANIADRDYFLYLKQHPGASTAVSRPVTSRYNGDHVIVFSHRVNRPDGSFAGVATIPVSVGYFDRLASRYVLGENGVMVLRDVGLDLISRYPSDMRGRKVDPGSHLVTRELNQLLASGASSGT